MPSSSPHALWLRTELSRWQCWLVLFFFFSSETSKSQLHQRKLQLASHVISTADMNPLFHNYSEMKHAMRASHLKFPLLMIEWSVQISSPETVKYRWWVCWTGIQAAPLCLAWPRNYFLQSLNLPNSISPNTFTFHFFYFLLILLHMNEYYPRGFDNNIQDCCSILEFSQIT